MTDTLVITPQALELNGAFLTREGGLAISSGWLVAHSGDYYAYELSGGAISNPQYMFGVANTALESIVMSSDGTRALLINPWNGTIATATQSGGVWTTGHDPDTTLGVFLTNGSDQRRGGVAYNADLTKLYTPSNIYNANGSGVALTKITLTWASASPTLSYSNIPLGAIPAPPDQVELFYILGTHLDSSGRLYLAVIWRDVLYQNTYQLVRYASGAYNSPPTELFHIAVTDYEVDIQQSVFSADGSEFFFEVATADFTGRSLYVWDGVVVKRLDTSPASNGSLSSYAQLAVIDSNPVWLPYATSLSSAYPLAAVGVPVILDSNSSLWARPELPTTGTHSAPTWGALLDPYYPYVALTLTRPIGATNLSVAVTGGDSLIYTYDISFDPEAQYDSGLWADDDSGGSPDSYLNFDPPRDIVILVITTFSVGAYGTLYVNTNWNISDYVPPVVPEVLFWINRHNAEELIVEDQLP